MAIKSRKKVPSDLIIELTSNLNGGMSFKDKYGNTNAYVSFRGIDDADTCSFDDLKAILKQKPKMLEKAYMVITDVQSAEDPNFTVDDLLRVINLYDLYHGSIYPQGLESFILTSRYETFTKKIQECKPELLEVIIERAVYLYKQGKLNDSMKMNYIQSLLPNVKMF